MHAMRRQCLAGICSLCLLAGSSAVRSAGPSSPVKLIAHWPMTADARDKVGDQHATAHGGVVFGKFGGRAGADFNGRDGYLEVRHRPALALGGDDFSIALWARPRRPLAGIPGDLISKWDAAKRRGINLYVAGSSSGYSGICDSRHVH